MKELDVTVYRGDGREEGLAADGSVQTEHANDKGQVRCLADREQSVWQAKAFRLIALDMDGTLLNPQGSVPLRNAEAIRRQQALGAIVVVCTGRSYHDAVLPLAQVGLHLDLLCMNGAVWYDADGEKRRTVPVEKRRTAMILELAEQYGLIADLMTDEGSVTTADEAAFRKSFLRGELLPVAEADYEDIRRRFRFADRRAFLEEGTEVYKISLIARKREQALLESVRTLLEKHGGLNIVSSAENNLELTDAQASKGQALRRYAQLRGIALSETAAVGDSENDLSMMRMPLGLKAAMGNAAPCIRAQADVITADNAQAGVAQVLEQLNGCQASPVICAAAPQS